MFFKAGGLGDWGWKPGRASAGSAHIPATSPARLTRAAVASPRPRNRVGCGVRAGPGSRGADGSDSAAAGSPPSAQTSRSRLTSKGLQPPSTICWLFQATVFSCPRALVPGPRGLICSLPVSFLTSGLSLGLNYVRLTPALQTVSFRISPWHSERKLRVPLFPIHIS